MAKTDLTAQRLRELVNYDPETGAFEWRVVGGTGRRTTVGWHDKVGYLRVCFDLRTYYAHRLAWLYVNGAWPRHVIDHVDGDRSNNAIANLRDVPQRMNVHNCKKKLPNRTGFAGVQPQGKSFSASIHAMGSRHIGTFTTAEEAHAAYLQAKKVHHEGWLGLESETET